MTTICFDGETLAVDSQVTYSTLISWYNKLQKWSGGYFTLAGELADYPRAKAWLEGEQEEFKIGKGSILIFTKGGKVYACEGPSGPPIEQKSMFAEGSGMGVAIGAMEAGASAVEAIRIAIKRDAKTGGKIRSVKIR